METNFEGMPLEHIQACLNEARKRAEVGDEPGVRNYLSAVDHKRRLTTAQFPAELLQEVVDLRRLANRNAFEKNIARAGQLAAEGEIGLTQGALAEARSNARVGEIEISPEQEKQFEEICRQSYLHAIPVRIQDAEREATCGHVAEVEGCIREISACAKVAGISLLPKVEDRLTQILQSARKECIANNLHDALALAGKREFDKAYGLLCLVGWHAQQGGLRFNEHQEAQYISVVQLLIRADYCMP